MAKEHLNLYLAAHAKLSVKSRNDRRGTLRMFLGWCVRNDYLAPSHRLLDADGMRKEAAEAAPIDYYRPRELRALLAHADERMRSVIALQAFGGLRLEEVTRLEWRDVFSIPGHVEVSSAKSKTRRRRLVEIAPTLAAWLEPYRGKEGPVWTLTLSGFVQAFAALRESLKIPPRRNGLRHGFVTFHFALHGNENLTAAQAGNSPAMIHAHYKGLGTRAEAEQWFAVAPAQRANVIPLPPARHTAS